MLKSVPSREMFDARNAGARQEQQFQYLRTSIARFHLAWVLCGLLSLPSLLAGTTEMSRLLGIAALSVLAISAPILLLQWGITLAKPLHSAIIISALPAVVLATDTPLGAALTVDIAVAMGALVGILLLGLRRVPEQK